MIPTIKLNFRWSWKLENVTSRQGHAVQLAMAGLVIVFQRRMVYSVYAMAKELKPLFLVLFNYLSLLPGCQPSKYTTEINSTSLLQKYILFPNAEISPFSSKQIPSKEIKAQRELRSIPFQIQITHSSRNVSGTLSVPRSIDLRPESGKRIVNLKPERS